MERLALGEAEVEVVVGDEDDLLSCGVEENGATSAEGVEEGPGVVVVVFEGE